eukprot:1489905-Prymnesium_polylepis.1
MLGGLKAYGASNVRSTARELDARLAGRSEGGGAQHVAVDARGHARDARQTRLRQSKLWMRDAAALPAMPQTGEGLGSRVN